MTPATQEGLPALATRIEQFVREQVRLIQGGYTERSDNRVEAEQLLADMEAARRSAASAEPTVSVKQLSAIAQYWREKGYAAPEPYPVVSEAMVERALLASRDYWDGVAIDDLNEQADVDRHKRGSWRAALNAALSHAPAGEVTLRDFTIEQMEEEIEWRRSHAPTEKE